MKINEKKELVVHQVDIDHIIGWFTDGDNLRQAIEREMFLAGLEGKWEFNSNKIIYHE